MVDRLPVRSTLVRVSAAVACCAVASLFAAPAASAQSAAAAQTRATSPALADLSRSLQDLAAKVTPAVVQIFVTGYTAPDEDNQTAAGEPALERTSGSGVIVDAEGYIVTNAHVVENATRLEVDLPLAATGGASGRSIIKRRGRTVGAQVVAIDRETDIAVIKVEARGLPTLTFGDSDELRPGQIVLAFGSPLGLESSVTMGVVSAVARQLQPEDPMIYIQIDAPINPGNSGGALVDTEGRLVGINTLIFSQSGGNEGIGFAAPSNIVRNVFGQIRKYGRVRRGEIGVHAQTITPVMAEALDLTTDAAVVLSDVIPGGPAEKAGLEPGDLVVALDGKRMENGRQFRINIYTRGTAESVSIEVQRGTRHMTVRVPVVERQHDATRLTELVTPQNAVRALGILALDLTPRILEILPPLRSQKGVVVATVGSEAPFSHQGRLQPGDVIYSLNRRTIESVEQLKSALDALKPIAPAVLQIEREGVLMYIAFRVERVER
jgi:serine protease Do